MNTYELDMQNRKARDALIREYNEMYPDHIPDVFPSIPAAMSELTPMRVYDYDHANNTYYAD